MAGAGPAGLSRSCACLLPLSWPLPAGQHPVRVHPDPPPLPAGDVVPMGVKEGDKVLLPDYGGTTVKLEDKE